MVEKNKNNTTSKMGQAATHASLAVMVVATLISMTELASREGHRVVGVLQPSYAYVGQNVDFQGHGDEIARRGKEEIRHTSASYGAVMRSHSVSGTL
jgi:hypothetical protein